MLLQFSHQDFGAESLNSSCQPARLGKCCPKKQKSWESSMPRLDEKQSTQHQHILKAGTISFDDSGIDCLVRKISDDGANLEVESQIGIPDKFDLVISSEHSDHHCHVVWRKGRRIGIVFD
jgi:hypothetical protein